MVPGTTDRFLCIPYGLLWDEVTASNLLMLDEASHFTTTPSPVPTRAGLSRNRNRVEAARFLSFSKLLPTPRLRFDFYLFARS